MSKFRVHSSPELTPPSSQDDYDDSALEGVAANVKLLLKLIQDHKDACYKQKKDGRRMLRVATMMTILDNVRNRIQKCQFGHKRSSEADPPGRSDADPKQVHSPTASEGKRSGGESASDEHQKFKKALNASLAARKSLEIMCSSLGKEKEIMSSELAKKVHELNEMDELINDLRDQNEALSEKVKEYAASDEQRRQHRENRTAGGAETHAHAAILQERNRALSEHLQRTLDGYRSLKRKLREASEENLLAQSTMEEMVVRVRESMARFRSFKERIASGSDPSADIGGEIVRLEQVFDRLQTAVTKKGHKKVDCVIPKSETTINSCPPTSVAV